MLDIHTAQFLDAVSEALDVEPGPHPVADFLLVRGLRRRTNAVREALALLQRDGDAEEALELLDHALSEPCTPRRVSDCGLIDPGPLRGPSLGAGAGSQPGAGPGSGSDSPAGSGSRSTGDQSPHPLPRPRPWPGL
ncbi:hypothetical protein [Nocardiopsis salina]|uniref:hypothetical protein n=1 Tax=Nocardiopsis salina TaxID=245836 RepID=UPI00034B910D|nr:hypothetical protein [Nocardiopsis salina]